MDTTKKDISNKEDIKLLVDAFYKRVVDDPVIGLLFTETFKVNWERHLPKMYDFWENVLFMSGGYSGNPMEVHTRLHNTAHFGKEHFDRWKRLWVLSVNKHFKGETAELAKRKATSIAAIMQFKLLNEFDPKFMKL
jgi:hemoglobin